MVSDQTDMETSVQVSDVLQEMMVKSEAVAAGWRDNDLPEGALLGESEVQGQQVRWKKQKSMVRAGNVPLPERFVAFDRTGAMSMLPTAQMARMLSKPRADDPSVRAFHTHSGGKTAATCSICPPPKEPIAQTCEFCLERTGNAVRKVFYSETAYRVHHKNLHPEEFDNLERNIERAERRAQIEAQQKVADAMMAMAQAPRLGRPPKEKTED